MPIDPTTGARLPYPEDMHQGAPMGDPGLPPELMALMGGGPPPAEQAPQQPAQDGPTILRQILEMASSYAQVEDDDEDLLQIEKLRTLAQQLLAKQQKELDDALNVTSSNRVLRRL